MQILPLSVPVLASGSGSGSGSVDSLITVIALFVVVAAIAECIRQVGLMRQAAREEREREQQPPTQQP